MLVCQTIMYTKQMLLPILQVTNIIAGHLKTKLPKVCLHKPFNSLSRDKRKTSARAEINLVLCPELPSLVFEFR